MNSNFKCLIYIGIASISALTTDISSFQNFSDITPIKWLHLSLNVILQGLIALRAYYDQSFSREKEQETDKPSTTNN